MKHGKVLWSWMTMPALLQAAAAAARPEGTQAVLRALGALTGTAAAVFGRLTSELRQSQAEAQPALEPVVFVAAALAREEALWLSLCCQVWCTHAGVNPCMACACCQTSAGTAVPAGLGRAGGKGEEETWGQRWRCAAG